MAIVTATPEPEAAPPRVTLALGWDAPAEGTLDTTVTLTRRDPDRSRPVRGAEPLRVTTTGPITVVDYEAPFGIPVVYEAVGADGTSVVSQRTVLSPTAWYPNDQGWSTERGAVWLRHLTIPSLSMPIDLSNVESPSFKATRSVVDVLGRRTPMVLTDGRRKALTSTVDIRTWSLEEGDRLRALLADNSPVLLSVPAGERWGVTHWYVTVGDLTEERLWQEWAPFEGRVFHLPVELVDRPSGGAVAAERSYFTLDASAPSYLALREQYPSYAALALPPAEHTATVYGQPWITGTLSAEVARGGGVGGTLFVTEVPPPSDLPDVTLPDNHGQMGPGPLVWPGTVSTLAFTPGQYFVYFDWWLASAEAIVFISLRVADGELADPAPGDGVELGNFVFLPGSDPAQSSQSVWFEPTGLPQTFFVVAYSQNGTSTWVDGASADTPQRMTYTRFS